MKELAKPEEPEAVEEEKIAEALKPRKAFSKLRRELNEDELSTPAVHRLLLDELDQSERQVVELSAFRDRFYKTDREKAILEERMRKSYAIEILFTVCLTLGAAFIGLTPSFENTSLGKYLFGIGILLILGGIASKWVQK